MNTSSTFTNSSASHSSTGYSVQAVLSHIDSFYSDILAAESMPGAYPTSSRLEAKLHAGPGVFPEWLKANPLHQAAFLALPQDSPARLTKKAFNRHFFKKCDTCQFSVFMFRHEERCHPQVLVQASLSPDSAVTIANSVLTFFNIVFTLVSLSQHFQRRRRSSDVLVQASLGGPPSDLSLFSRYARDDLTGQTPGGAHQRIERIRADVRFIEGKIDQMLPILQSLTGGSTTTPPTGGSGSTPITFPPLPIPTGTDPSIPGPLVPNQAPTPLGDGRFPMTIEGQIARILFNLRIQAQTNGVVFQATLSPVRPEYMDVEGSGSSRFPANRPTSDVLRSHLTVLQQFEQLLHSRGLVSSLTLSTLPSTTIPMTSVVQADGSIYFMYNMLDQYTRFVPLLSQNLALVPPPPSSGGTPGTGSTLEMTRRMDMNIDRALRNLLSHMSSAGSPIIQATLSGEHSQAMNELVSNNASLTIADVDQVLEPTKDVVVADTPMEEQLNELDTWTVKNVLSRPTLVSRTLWNSQARGTEIANVSFPNQWLTNIGRNVHFTNMLNAFTMMKANVVFRLVTNTTPMYGGILAMGFDFYGRLHSRAPQTSGTPPRPTLDDTTISNCDPVYLDISAGTVVEMSVPFSAVSQYLSRQHAPLASQFMGTLFVNTMSTLYRPAGAPDVEIRLYAYVEMPAVAVLQEPDNRSFVVPQANIVKSITAFSHSYIPNMQDVYPLALESGYHVKRENTCRVEDIGHVYGIIGTAQWTTSTPVDTELFQVPVHPMAHRRLAVSGTRFYQAPKIAHLARHYSYWNGTLEYKIEVACSASHAGKLYIVFHSGSDYQGGNVIETNAHILLDVQKQHELEFSVPFSSPTPWKPTYLFQPFGDIDMTRTGSVHIVSADGIKSALTPNSDITVNLYVRCGKDFQLAVPRNGLQGGAITEATIAQVSLTSLRPSLARFREDFNDIYKVLRRFTPLGTNPRTTTGESIVIPVRPILPRNLGDNSVSIIAGGFAFWRGSMSYKFKVLDCTSNRAAFEVYHVPTLGIPSGMDVDEFFKMVGPAGIDDRSGTGSFFGSQTFHADIDKEWEVTVPYYSMYDHLHLPLTHYEGGADQKNKLPLLSTNNGCLIVRSIFGKDDSPQRAYSVSVSVSCGTDFTLLAPTAYPLIRPMSISDAAGQPLVTLGRDVTVTAQASLDDDVEIQGLFSFFSNLSTIADNVENLTSIFRKDVDEDSKEYITSMLEDLVTRLVNRAKITVSGWLRNLVPDVDWKLLATGMIAACILYKFRDNSVLSKVLIAALGSLVSHKVLNKISEYISEYMDPQISAQVGAGLDINHVVQLCCGVLAVLLNLDLSKGVKGMVKNLGELGKNLSGIKSGTEAIKYFSAYVSENIVPSLSVDDTITLKGLMNDSVQILEEVYQLNLEEMRVACLTQKEIKDRVLKCDGRLHELQQLALANPCPNSIVQTIQRAKEKMAKLRTEVMKYKGEDGYRIDPFHISVYGPPKIGKSAMMNKVSDDLIVYHGLPTTNKVYTRSPENVYWDNYQGQTTTMFDDLGQIAATNPPSDLSELISLKSNAPYMVHMASLAEKGTYFSSTFIISSTNFKLYDDCNYVKSKEALHRRRDVLVEMQPKVTDPVTGLMPGEQFARGLEGEDSYAQFRILNSITGEATSEWMSYDELIIILARKSEAHLREQRALVERNTKATTASAVIQAILREREPTIPVVQLGDETVVVDVEAQGLLDSLPTAEAREQMLTRWREQFKNALYWKDFGALTSGLPSLSQSKIASAIRMQSAEGLDRIERRLYNVWQASASVQKRSATVLTEARESITQVGLYFEDLWKKLPTDRRKMFSTALVSLGALAVGVSLYSVWQRSGSPEVSNIPLDIFMEGDDSYKSKDRSPPPRKHVAVEGPAGAPRKTRVYPESGKLDDLKDKRGGRKVVLESARDFEKWSAEHPNMLPYRFEFNERDGTVVVEEHPLWRDFEEYCNEVGHTSRWTLPPSAPGYTGPSMIQNIYDFFSGIKSRVLPESGKLDDLKDVRGKRVVRLEADLPQNPMLRDVPEDYFQLSEEDLIKAMTTTQDIGTRKTVAIDSDTTKYTMIDVQPQYTADTQAVQLMQEKLISNVGFIFHDKSQYRMRCLVIDDRFIVLPKHFFLLQKANWQQNDDFQIWIRGVLYQQKFHKKNLLCWPNRDMCLYLLSARVTGAKSVLSYIADRAAHQSYRTCDGSLFAINCEKGGSIFFDRHHLPVVSRMTEADHERIQYPVGTATHILKGYVYSADTVNGDCGSVLLQHNVRQHQKILGLHVAAQTGITRSFSELLVQEEVAEKMAELIRRTEYITTGSVLHTVDLAKRHAVMVQGSLPGQMVHLNENIDIFGKAPVNMIKRTPDKTEIRPSPLQGHIDIEPKTEPAPLSVKDPRCLSGVDPLIFQVGGYGLESKPFNPDHLELIKEHQINKLRKYDGFINKRTLTLDEAINGIPGVDYADAMNMNSAEGTFWNLSRPFWAHNKSWMFENLAPEGERAKYKINRDCGLLEKIVHRLLEAKAGRRVLSTTSESLKDERRPFKKTRPPTDATPEEIKNFTPGTRSFTILPVDYNILVRMFFWDFAAMIMKNRGTLSAQVGIDPCSIEWTGLIRRLLATSNMGFAGDYKNYDRQTPAEFMDLACDIINGWYNDGPVNAQIRKVLMGEAFDHLSLVRGVYIHINKGLPSGFPLTVIVNCLNNDTYKYCAWLSLAPPKLISLDQCDENVDSAFYGDDNLHAITPVASPFFNMQTVGRFLGEHGVELTDEHKNKWQTAAPLVRVEDCSFLKRLFVKHPDNHLYLAPLEKRSIEDRLLWITDSKFMAPEELLRDNIVNSLRDAFHWGPGYFLELKTKIAKGLESAYPDPTLRRMLEVDVTYGGEELRWMMTCKYLDQMGSFPLKDVFGC